MAKIVLFFLLLFQLPAFAGVEQISESDFQNLASELAKKVNLFQEVWKQDPSAEFYGGTTRDYLYWLKGNFREAFSKEQAHKIIRELRALPSIDVRTFIIGDSDVDVVSKIKPTLEAAHFGVRKFDVLSSEIFDPKTDLGKNELWQGHAPAEKIRLSNNGISQNAELGNGLHEIYTGKLSVHFTDPKLFQETKYAKAGENHPILLALRYLRLQAINYYRSHGQGYPDRELLLAAMDPASREAVRHIIQSTLDGEELKPYLERTRFKSWINGTIQKAFRSYTNPTAALLLMKEFGVDQLSPLYGEKNIEPIYQYVFAKHRAPKPIAANFQKYGIQAETFFEDPKKHFPDGFLYHGTRSEPAFRSILFQGVMPSDNGKAGPGLYGVSSRNRIDAEEWGGTKDRLIKLPVKAHAKIVDITKGEGQRVWREFSEHHGEDFKAFVETFGIDVLKYPFRFEAYVANNSETLGQAKGVYRELLPFQEFIKKVRDIQDPKTLVNALAVNQFSSPEILQALQESSIPKEALANAVEEALKQFPVRVTDAFGGTDLWKENHFRFAQAQIPSLVNALRVQQGKLLGEDLGMSRTVDYLKEKKWPYAYDALQVLSQQPRFHMNTSSALKYAREECSPEEHMNFIRTAIFENPKLAGERAHYLQSLLHGNLRDGNPQLMPIVAELITRFGALLRKEMPELLSAYFIEWLHYPEVWQAAQSSSREVAEEAQRIRDFMTRSAWLGPQETLSSFLLDSWSLQRDFFGEILEKGDMTKLEPKTLLALETWVLNLGQANGRHAAIYRKLLETYPQYVKESAKTLDYILAHWHDYPEVLEPFLVRDDYPEGGRKILTEGFMYKENWLRHKEILGRFLQNFGTLASPIPELTQDKWWTNPFVLRKLIDDTNPPRGERDPLYQIVFQLLLENDLWTKDPDLLQTVIRHSNIASYILRRITESTHLIHYPKVMEALIDAEGKNVFANSTVLAEALSKPEWVEHPDLIRRIFSQKQRKDWTVVTQILGTPVWAKHPELLMELATHAEEWKIKDQVAKLLLLDQWKQHPMFHHLQVQGILTFENFVEYARRQRPTSSCAPTFKRFIRP